MPEGSQCQENKKQNKRLSVAKCKRLFIFLTASSLVQSYTSFSMGRLLFYHHYQFCNFRVSVIVQRNVFAQSSFSRVLYITLIYVLLDLPWLQQLLSGYGGDVLGCSPDQWSMRLPTDAVFPRRRWCYFHHSLIGYQLLPSDWASVCPQKWSRILPLWRHEALCWVGSTPGFRSIEAMDKFNHKRE